jgi:hypothetical protein
MKMKARLGVSMHIGVVCISFRDGSPSKFFWWASETDPNEFDDSDREQVLAMAKKNGPFDTAAEAEHAARIAIGIGPDCEIQNGGKWSKPH